MFEDNEIYLVVESPLQLPLSPNAPITSFHRSFSNKFNYNTFDNGNNVSEMTPPSNVIDHTINDNKTKNKTSYFHNLYHGYHKHGSNGYHYHHHSKHNLYDNPPRTPVTPVTPVNQVTPFNAYGQHNMSYVKINYSNSKYEIYSSFGVLYRKFCFSSAGIKFTICLNLLMVLINTFLIIYETVLMIKMNHGDTYYNFQLPLIYSLCDVLLTFILFFEISLHLFVIYKCKICEYVSYNNHHKLDIFVFFCSLFLCIIYIGDIFGISDMDNFGFLIIRIVRDVMRFLRCFIFAKILYDSYIQWNTPKQSRYNNIGNSHAPKSPTCSSGWEERKLTDDQTKLVCV